MTADIEGDPLLSRVIDRVKKSRLLDSVILATSKNINDDILCEIAKKKGISVYRGSENDVLKRVFDAHKSISTDIIVQICGDCPLIDPGIIDLCIETYLANDCDLVSCGAKQSYPQGTEVHVFSIKALEHIVQVADDPAYREHVCLYFHENSDNYEILHIEASKENEMPSLRLQVDYPEDLALVREIYKKLIPIYGNEFGVSEIIELVNREDSLIQINNKCVEKPTR